MRTSLHYLSFPDQFWLVCYYDSGRQTRTPPRPRMLTILEICSKAKSGVFMLLIRSAFKPYSLAYFGIFSPTHVFGTFVNSQGTQGT